MVHQLTRISIGQTSKVIAVMYGLFGLIYIPMGFVMNAISPAEAQISMWFWLIFPLIFVVFGYLFVALSCAIYNGVAKFVGGIEFTLDVKEEVDL